MELNTERNTETLLRVAAENQTTADGLPPLEASASENMRATTNDITTTARSSKRTTTTEMTTRCARSSAITLGETIARSNKAR